MIKIILLILLATTTLAAQDKKNVAKAGKEISPEIKNESPSSKKFYLYLLGNYGRAETELEKGKMTGAHIGFEYRFFPYIGIGLEFGANHLDMNFKSNCIAYQIDRKTNFPFHTGGLNFNFHINKDRFLDPFIGVGVLYGTCGDYEFCNVNGTVGRLGLQLNFEKWFLVFQSQYRALRFSAKVQDSNLTNLDASVGIGFRL
jgi:hypothetical protein